MSCDEKKRKAVAVQDACLERIRSLLESRNKEKEAFTKFKDLGRTVYKVFRQSVRRQEQENFFLSGMHCTKPFRLKFQIFEIFLIYSEKQHF